MVTTAPEQGTGRRPPPGNPWSNLGRQIVRGRSRLEDTLSLRELLKSPWGFPLSTRGPWRIPLNTFSQLESVFSVGRVQIRFAEITELPLIL